MSWKAHELRLFGHRGASARLPENTMEAFSQALEDGATALELDVHLSCDGHVVVAHDEDGRRMAGREQSIRSCTLEELGRWNVAATFGGAGTDVMRMPTLIEVLDAFSGVPISVDLKPNDSRVAHGILETVRERDAEPRVTIGSFHSPILHLARRLGYRGPTALTRAEVALIRFLPAPLIRPWIRGQAAMIPRRHGSISLDGTSFIRRCRALGLRVDYWVVNTAVDARQLLAAGATGVISDDPRVLAPVMAEAR